MRKPAILRRTARRAGALLCAACLLGVSAAHAFTDLTEAQNLIYDTAHLANTAAGDVVGYHYDSRGLGDTTLTDAVTLTVRAASEGEQRDVTLDFLSGEHRLALPDFDGYRGNPVIVATLEQFARTFSAETGGGTLYFRNRMRNALAGKDVLLTPVQADYHGKPVNGRQLSIRPFDGDPYLGAKPEYRDTVIDIVISDGVPAGVLRIEAISAPAGDGKPYFIHTLAID